MRHPGGAERDASKALALDVPPGPDGKPSALLGPLRHLQRRLAVRADIFGESRTPEEGALLLLEQVRSARPALRERLDYFFGGGPLSERYYYAGARQHT